MTKTSTYNAILELPWLEDYNPIINYAKKEMVFNGCACKKNELKNITVKKPGWKEILITVITEEYDRNLDSVYLIILAVQANPTEFTIL